MQQIKWHIETRNVSTLKEWIKNPRKLTNKGLADLTKSIDKFGLAEPIVINTDGTILGGHARVKVLKAKGEKECDCYVPDRLLTEKEVEEINIRLNANIAGEFEWEALVKDWDVEKLSEWGLDVPVLKEIKDLSEKLESQYKIEIECSSEDEQEKLYNEFQKRNLSCRILTL
jgi:site-specific DNA-methyltransferase (adenine-specific)